MNRPKTKSEHRTRRHIRIRSRVSGVAEKPRLIVFRSLKYTYAQLIDDKTGKTLAAAHDMAAKSKKTKLERAAEVGKELAEKAEKAGIKTCVFDRNGYKYHGRVKAVADGAREGGLNF
ncbi:MAG: 50S ribosomal protein L18 [Candidatus Gracilibacteria bacterium]|jgi:large subunit ribosomal protein L18